MARINLDAMVDWQNGQKVTAEKVRQDRTVLVTAINDNYNRVKDLEDNTQVASVKEHQWEATVDNQTQFILPFGIEFPDIENVLEVSVEGFVLTEGEEFIKLNSTTLELSTGVSVGTRVYARWHELKVLKLFTNDIANYNIMGVF